MKISQLMILGLIRINRDLRILDYHYLIECPISLKSKPNIKYVLII